MTTKSRGEKRPENIDRVFDLLEEMWKCEKNPPDLAHEEPLDGLILTLLSQNTNDLNRDKAFAALKARFPSWNSAARAPVEEIAGVIRPAGLAPTKSARMAEILAVLQRDFGEYSLRRVREWSTDEIRNYLLSLPGIGPKTAACVLLFDLGRPAFPVDTHIARFCRRMEWVGETTPPDLMIPLMESWVPPARFLGGHVNIILHGRGICKARKPECGRCALSPLCPYDRRKGETGEGLPLSKE